MTIVAIGIEGYRYHIKTDTGILCFNNKSISSLPMVTDKIEVNKKQLISLFENRLICVTCFKRYVKQSEIDFT